MRPLSMRKIREILRQRYELKCSYREIARSLNIGTSSVSDYLARARSAGIEWPLPKDTSEETLFNQLFLPVKNVPQRPLPDFEYVYKELRKKGVTLQLLWREYRDLHPTGLSYAQFCARYNVYTKITIPVMRQIHKGGEKTFVDYAGMTVDWLDILTGEIHHAQIFVGSLGASQFTFAEASNTQTLADWIESHIRMWEYFGGVSEIVIPDNLKAGVTKAHRYDPDVNANYQHFSEHYGFAIVPARPYEPKDKAKVENAVGCIERQILAPLRHMTFTSIAEINAAIKPKLMAFNQKQFQKMQSSRQALFEEIDKPALKPLPPERYQYAQWRRAKVHIDYHIAFEDHFYSVPYQYIQQEIEIRATATVIECFHQGKRIAMHTLGNNRQKFHTMSEHMPPAHRAHSEWSPERIKRWANKIGPQATKFIDHMITSRSFPEQAYRACLGVLRLASRYGEERLENACNIAYSSGATRYQQIEAILKNKLDTVTQSQKNDSSSIKHENIRGPHYYK